jgi:hypothetical protein
MLSARGARFAAVVIAVAAVAGARIAWSAIPGEDGVTHAC